MAKQYYEGEKKLVSKESLNKILLIIIILFVFLFMVLAFNLNSPTKKYGFTAEVLLANDGQEKASNIENTQYTTGEIKIWKVAATMDIILNPFEVAECLSRKGAKMYGTYWCNQCMEQKAMFGDAFDTIEYVECDLGDNKRATECLDNMVGTYPVWIIDGKRLEGKQNLKALWDFADCQ